MSTGPSVRGPEASSSTIGEKGAEPQEIISCFKISIRILVFDLIRFNNTDLLRSQIIISIINITTFVQLFEEYFLFLVQKLQLQYSYPGIR